ncbi:MAG: isopeptide-forming domain-containing fimbrial protein [Oribacterium sp.]|nr:isopeptide-forming domain-containing fimbrial protein [Oribacterium sp.]
MKKFKKIASLVLAASMIGAMPVSVLAATNETTGATTELGATAKISTESDRTFEVYQIFTGDLSDGKLSNLKWGSNGTGTKDHVVPDDVIKALTDLNKEGKTYADKLAIIETYANMKNPVGTVTKDSPWTGRTGYYIFKDVTALKDGESYSLNVTLVNGDTEIKPKAGTTTSEKKVKDTNDTTGDTSDWKDSADWDVNDVIPFQLKATIAEDYANYTKGYKLTFHDNESAGLTFNEESVVVKVDGKDVATSAYSVVKGTEKENPCTFEVHFENLKDIADVKAGSVITVDYTATLNEKAKIGSEGNPNESHITFTNNPNDNQAGENGKTPNDKVIVFTYQVEANKYIGNADGTKGEALNGASFTLYKMVADSKTEGVQKGSDIKAALKKQDATKSVNTDAFEDGSYYVSLGEVDGSDKNTFLWKRIDDGKYVLVETKTPAGYNSKEAMSFEVKATHTDGDEPALSALNGDKLVGNITLTAYVPTGKLSTDVLNVSGSQLPTTGGMGTTILYVAGAILVIAGGAVLVIKKRHEA